MNIQVNLFPDFVESVPDALIPTGFRYQSELVSVDEEVDLLEAISTVSMEHFVFQGFLAKRKVAPFGFLYDEKQKRMVQASEIPSFLLELRTKIAAFANRSPDDFKQAMLIEYEAGAPIGWHRDRPYYGEIVGVSLLSVANFRLRLRTSTGWTRTSKIIAPRSVYIMAGESRTLWEHSIPPVESLRYAITFRTIV